MLTPKTLLVAAIAAGAAYYLLKPSNTVQTVDNTGGDWWELPEIEMFDFSDSENAFWPGLDETGDWIQDTYQSASDWLSGAWDVVTE